MPTFRERDSRLPRENSPKRKPCFFVRSAGRTPHYQRGVALYRDRCQAVCFFVVRASTTPLAMRLPVLLFGSFCSLPKHGASAARLPLPDKTAPYSKIGHLNPYHSERENLVFRREMRFFPCKRGDPKLTLMSRFEAGICHFPESVCGLCFKLPALAFRVGNRPSLQTKGSRPLSALGRPAADFRPAVSPGASAIPCFGLRAPAASTPSGRTAFHRTGLLRFLLRAAACPADQGEAAPLAPSLRECRSRSGRVYGDRTTRALPETRPADNQGKPPPYLRPRPPARHADTECR